jgi:hypothetical protein
MEVERLRALSAYAARDEQRLAERKRGAAILREQLEERARQRAAAAELRDQVGGAGAGRGGDANPQRGFDTQEEGLSRKEFDQPFDPPTNARSLLLSGREPTLLC